jgi:hypothetical protein
LEKKKMTEMKLANARELDISQHAPPTASHIRLKIGITPNAGAVLVYSPAATDPVKFDGPEQTKDVPLSGPKIYYQLVQGATDLQIAFVGYIDPR